MMHSPDEHVLALFQAEFSPWFADIANYLAVGIVPHNFTSQQKKIFFVKVKYHLWDDLIIFRQCADQIIRRCVSEGKMEKKILKHYHSLECGGHFNGQRITAKILQAGFYWNSSFKDANLYSKSCDRCQRTCNIEKRNEMPSTTILEVELFYLWGIYFMGPFPLGTNTYCWL